MAKLRTIAAGFMALTIVGAPFAQARVQDYQIVRLLTYKTDCQLNTLKAMPSSEKSLRFFATCENLTFYPNGIEIVCDASDDDRSCRLLTQPRSFDQLYLLNPRK